MLAAASGGPVTVKIVQYCQAARGQTPPRRSGSSREPDFGLARVTATRAAVPVSAVDGSSATETLIAGTPGYIAPEQARGELSSTAADLWSFGVLLGELASKQGRIDGLAAGMPGFHGVPACRQHGTGSNLIRLPTIEGGGELAPQSARSAAIGWTPRAACMLRRLASTTTTSSSAAARAGVMTRPASTPTTTLCRSWAKP